MKISIHKSWFPFFNKNLKLIDHILHSISQDDFLPDNKLIFRSFKYFDLKKTKLVFLGMDPYPGFSKENNKEIYYAEGLSFSVNPNIQKLPGSLKNIFKELENNYPDFKYENGSLKKWVKKENIMLLNTALTVKKGKPNSHTKYWEGFTDKVIQELDENSECLFLLMGNNAKKKAKLIKNKFRIVTCVHPSPLSAHRGFLGSEIFKKLNEKLKDNEIKEINWNL